MEKEGVQGVGGFSLIFGELRKDAESGQRGPLGVISNRTPDFESVTWVAGVDSPTQAWTCALSNSLYGDDSWPKVNQAQDMLEQIISKSTEADEDEDQFLQKCFKLLSTDTLPKRQTGESWQAWTRQLRESIFIPATDTNEEVVNDAADAGSANGNTTKPRWYGTQKQTVILVDHSGKATFVERTLFDNDARPVDSGEQDRRFDFQIEGWLNSDLRS